MPLPFIIGAGAALLGGVGIKKTLDAKENQDRANRKNRRAGRIVNEARERMDVARKNCGDELEHLGKTKVRILQESVVPFVEEFEKLHHVEMEESAGLDELHKLVLDKKEFRELKEMGSMASSLASGLAQGALTGGLTAFGAFGAVGMLASASTGTAIAALSGAAATNATLAFLGGGTLAAGGLGIAGGTMVLGGLVAGPALAIMGCVIGSKAAENLEEAKENLAEAEAFSEEMDTAITGCNGIRKRTAMFSRFLLSLNALFEPQVYALGEIIKKSGTDYRKFSEAEKNTVVLAASTAGAIKAILDTPILNEQGKLTSSSAEMVELTEKRIGELQA